MVVSVSRPASEAGLAVLKKGGNAVDAAVAVAFALAVTWPEAGNIGGGGFMLVWPGKKGEPEVIDYRETAPAAATRDMFAKDKRPASHKLVGVPGMVAGLALAHARHGKLAWKDLVAPAVELAEKGFVLDAKLAGELNKVVAEAKDYPELRRVYGKDGGRGAWRAGDRLVLPELARSLRIIAEKGRDGFYRGALADLLVAEMKRGGGLITHADLAGYAAKVRRPVRGSYRGHDIYGPPPPSSGGTCLVEMLNILENFDLKKSGRYSPRTLHLMTEAMRRAYADRARYLGDPGFVTVPARLTTKAYAKKLAAGIDPNKATRSEEVAPDVPLTPEGDSTTHFSVIDAGGMAVSNTYTLEQAFGGKVVVRGAGFLLNNEMLDFNLRPGVTTREGGIGTEPNTIRPGKRMLSSQTPVIVTRGGRPYLVTGSPGGRTIVNTVLCVVVNVVDFEMPIREAVGSPRMHHAWFPDELQVEPALLKRHAAAVKALQAMGHRLAPKPLRQGDAHSIRIDPGTGVYQGAADTRRGGWAAGW
jgi:gamma-glutamyltranspeptidase/glutathione hydrolase